MSPLGPPRCTTLPTPRIVLYWPIATPAGIRTSISFSPLIRPSPLHFLQGDEITVPSPEQLEHGATLTTWPKKERCARCTSPLPRHVAHVTGDDPGSAPLPSHRSHGSSRRVVTVFSEPLAASNNVIGIAILMSVPERGPDPRPPAPPNRSPNPPSPPRSRMKMFSASERSTWWNPAAPPRNPASP